MRYSFYLDRAVHDSNGSDDVNRQTVATICHTLIVIRRVIAVLLLIMMMFPIKLYAHGGVVMEDDQCVIDIGLFRAHFTIYQPKTQASEEFCEDVPDLGEAIFAMDYLHDSLRQLPVDFRIVRDVNDSRSYASWEDIEAISDLDEITLYYQAAQTKPSGSLTAKYHFEEKGWYIGIVTTRQTGSDKIYRAVFGFHVGGQGYGFWPLLVFVVLLVQLQYWISSGGLKRLKAGRGERSETSNIKEE